MQPSTPGKLRQRGLETKTSHLGGVTTEKDSRYLHLSLVLHFNQRSEAVLGRRTLT